MNNTKEFLEEHLSYELAMFYNSVFMQINFCKEMTKDELSFVNNLRSESAVNHARVLIEFFFKNKKMEGKNDAKAYDFFNSKEDWNTIRGDFDGELINDFLCKSRK